MSESRNRVLNHLKSGASSYSCAGFISSLDSLHRAEIFTSLLFDRLDRKYKTVEQLYAESSENWNQTFYLMYFRTLGDRKNQNAYLTIARRVPYSILLRERNNLQRVEALLFGCSGLLDLYRNDIYTQELKREFEYLSHKYNIQPITSSEWDLSRIRPANHPILRIAQAASFFALNQFLMDQVMECKTAKDIYKLFCTEASSYWSTHIIPAVVSGGSTKRIGQFKSNIIGINLVAIMQYAYGSYIANETLRDRAISLLEILVAEDNLYMKGWRSAGLIPKNAFESQALLQLVTEYCSLKLCDECIVGKRLIKKVLED